MYSQAFTYAESAGTSIVSSSPEGDPVHRCFTYNDAVSSQGGNVKHDLRRLRFAVSAAAGSVCFRWSGTEMKVSLS